MTTNGGTLHGIPQHIQPRGLNCSQCGLIFDSAESLQVHMHYHPESMNRWGAQPNISGGGGGGSHTASSTASNSPTDSENNNHPKQRHHSSVNNSIQQQSKSASPMHNTISAAADSSDNQPPTPQPDARNGGGGNGIGHGFQSTGAASPYQHQTIPAEMHYPAYMHSYEQYYHHHNMEYGLPPPHFLNSQPQQPEYKAVPSPRYHPYMSHSMSAHGHPHIGNVTNSALSPRIVSSSSPTQNSLMHGTTATAPSQAPPPGQPTPSPSPKQCDKCGLVCETACQLSDHYATAHGTTQPQSDSSSMNRSGGGPGNGSSDENDMPSFPAYTNYPIKEEPPCDILDLDSQKMVYPPHEQPDGGGGAGIPQGPLPPMHSLHPMQRPPMPMWAHDHHAFLPPHPQDLKQSLFPSIKQEYGSSVPPTIKQEFSPTSSLIKNEFAQQHQTQLQQQDVKSFNNEVTSNQVANSPPDFPTTTTPQENGVQFRTSFEAATSSLPNNPPSAKAASWKSNEARRPKTYNCTACNKWFTSSGHLKRHYNTTLHKNAVKSSGQPDPATMPISIHHHPTRDQNHKHHRGSPAQAGPPPVPPEPPRSPDYMLGFQQAPPGFQQYGATSCHSNTGGPPNGQAGLSVRASQPRGLLIYLTNTGTQHTQLPEEEPSQPVFMPAQMQQQLPVSHYNTITNSMDPYSIISPITINTNIQSLPAIPHQEALQPNYHTIIGRSADQCEGSTTDSNISSMLDYDTMYMSSPSSIDHNVSQYGGQMRSYNAATIPGISALRRLTGGAAAYQGDTAPPFSPDIPESYPNAATAATQHRHGSRSSTPRHQSASIPSPDLPITPSPCSPSITSTGPPTPTVCDQQQQQQQLVLQQQQQQQQSANDALRCIQCDKVFNKACYLTQHNKTFHSGEKPYKCQRCGKRFPCGQSHEEHLAKHGNDKPFKCDQCPKQFNHKTDLRRHMCLHNGTKPYSCEMCGKGFIRKDHMLKHCETHRRKSALLARKYSEST